MLGLKLLTIVAIVFVAWLIYIWRDRSANKNGLTTADYYMWKLGQITDKTEYEIFQIAAREKGWSEEQVERDFNQYIKGQTLPVYVKEFLKEGKEHIDDYQPVKGDVFDKKLLVFYIILGVVMLGGALLVALWIFPGIWIGTP